MSSIKAISQSKEKFSHGLMRLSGSGLIKLTMINRGLRGLVLSLLLFLVLMKKFVFVLLFIILRGKKSHYLVEKKPNIIIELLNRRGVKAELKPERLTETCN